MFNSMLITYHKIKSSLSLQIKLSSRGVDNASASPVSRGRGIRNYFSGERGAEANARMMATAIAVTTRNHLPK